MKNLTLCAILAILTAVLLSACAAPPPAKPTPPRLAKELVFYDWEDDMPQEVLDDFKAEYGVEVKYVTYTASEEAMENISRGQVYDVVVIESRLIPILVAERQLAEIDSRNVPNRKNISANFRDLAYDPENKHNVPFNWGTTGLVLRSDLVKQPITRWADLWDPRYAGKVGIWKGQSREIISLTLKSLGYSANSEKPAELQAALKRLLTLKSNVVFLEDFDPVTAAPPLVEGRLVFAMGYAADVLKAREKNASISYVLPEEGALLWGDTFVIPANSPNKYTAELFLNFILRPQVSAKITNYNFYPMPNDAAAPFIDPQILNDPVIFPHAEDLRKGEIVLPLGSQGQKLYDSIWEQFLATGN